MPITVRIKFKSFQQKLVRYIKTELADHMSHVLNRVANPATARVQDILRQHIQESEEMQTLRNPSSELYAEIGTPDIADRIDRAIAYWLDTVFVLVKPPKHTTAGLAASLQIRAVPQKYSDVLAQDFASYDSVNSKGNITNIPWLKWFLLEGVSPVVDNYFVSMNIDDSILNRYSRTKEALMLPAAGAFYRIPSAYSGTAADNFLTRAIDKSEKDIIATLIKLVDREWGKLP